MSGGRKLSRRLPAQLANWYAHPDILKKVEEMAAAVKTQRTIASELGKTLKVFEAALAANKGENPLRLAWEAGHAKAEQKQIDACVELKPDGKAMIAWIFYMKAVFGWKDKPEQATNEGAKISFILPGHMSEVDYYRKLGIEGPIDTRPAHMRGAGAPGASGGPDMKDVTPGADGKLPVLGAQAALPAPLPTSPQPIPVTKPE